MYGNTGDCFAGGNHSLVYVVSVHAFAAEFGQQRRMYVKNPVVETA